MTKMVLVVAAALFDGQGRVLLAQRPEGKAMAGLWEFPGGKVELGETPEEALIREIGEELGAQISVNDLVPVQFASHTYESFHLLMPLYACRVWRGDLEAQEGQKIEWVETDRLFDYPAPAADLPLFEALQDWRWMERTHGGADAPQLSPGGE